jgi:hypothetical protein
LAPEAVSQKWLVAHVPLDVHTPPLQRSVTFEALPLHASAPGLLHGHPSVPTAPVPLVAHGPASASAP